MLSRGSRSIAQTYGAGVTENVKIEIKKRLLYIYNLEIME